MEREPEGSETLPLPWIESISKGNEKITDIVWKIREVVSWPGHVVRSSRVNNLREVLTWLRGEDTCGIGRVGLLRRRDIGSWSFAKVELSEFGIIL